MVSMHITYKERLGVPLTVRPFTLGPCQTSEGRALAALRSVGLDSGTLPARASYTPVPRTPYTVGTAQILYYRTFWVFF